MSGLDRISVWAFLAIGIAFTVAAGSFAHVQEIWVDETTQLTGLALPPDLRWQWLIGAAPEAAPNVPVDRMPPLSYWLGALWADVFGLSEASMRWFGIACVLAAAPALHLSGERLGGTVGSVICVSTLLLSPGLVIISGEIRAYPLFFLSSAWSLWALIRALDPDRAQRIDAILLAVFCIVGGYTHFFGVVLAAFCFGTLALGRVMTGRSLVEPILVGALVFLALAGILPFVSHAVGVSDHSGAGSSIIDTARRSARMVSRLFLHGTHSVWPVALWLVVAGAGLLAGLSLRRVWLKGDRHLMALWLTLPVAVFGLTGLGYQFGSFDVLAPHYNLWMAPFAAALIAAGIDPVKGGRGSTRLGLGGISLIFAGHGVALAVLGANLAVFTHGGGEWLAQRVAPDPGERTLLLHRPESVIGHAYFPVAFLLGETVTQVQMQPDGTAKRIGPMSTSGMADAISDPASYALGFDRVYEVTTLPRTSAQLADSIRGRRPCLPEAPEGAETRCAYYSVFLVERR